MAGRGDGGLTNRENASLNSETCSSVRESACDCVLAVVPTREGRAIAMFCRAGYATPQEGHAPWLLEGVFAGDVGSEGFVMCSECVCL